MNRSFNIFLSLIIGLLSGDLIFCQTGPNSPVNRANDASIGTNAWTQPNNVNSSNDNYATCGTKGITNYISTGNYGFAISVPSTIDGIMLEIERSTTASTAVAVLNNWTTGMTKTISAGVSRCLIAAVFLENGLGPRGITSLTYGGQALTKINEAFVGSGTGFCAKIEYWRLMETGITAAANTSFAIAYNGTSLLENWESVSSAVFQFVDQTIPVLDAENFLSNNANNPITLSPAISTRAGGLTISGIFCGNNTTPASAIGGTNTYTINSGFTEVIDTYTANPSFSTSGGSFQLANKLSATTTTEAPTYTFGGTANRQVISCIHLQNIRESDNSVRLIRGGTIVGNNYAQNTNSWPATDAYATYGGPTDLWGTTWSDIQINANNFGAVISASVQNGTARVDHMRITVYSTVSLPIELVDFSGEVKNNKNHIYWQTASEKNNKQFIIERSSNMIDFETIAIVTGKGNSVVFNDYEFIDETPLRGQNYYRLKQVDHDGSYKYYRNIVLNNSGDKNELIVYPNPSPNGLFNIKKNETPINTVTIYTTEFKLIKTVPLNTADINFSLEELADGFYYMVYASPEGQKIKRISKSCSTH